MKKLFTALICATMVIAIGGCGDNKKTNKELSNEEVGDILEKEFKISFSYDGIVDEADSVKMESNKSKDFLHMNANLYIHNSENGNSSSLYISSTDDNKVYHSNKEEGKIEEGVIRINECMLDVSNSDILKRDFDDNECSETDIEDGKVFHDKIATLLDEIGLSEQQIYNYMEWYTKNNVQNLRETYDTKKKEKEETKKKEEKAKKDAIKQNKEEKKSFKSSCKTYDYKDVFRNAEDYQGKPAKFSGEVIQVMDVDGGSVLRVNVTPDEYGIYEDTIYVLWFDDDKGNDPDAINRVIEDDIITMYGTLEGTETYEATSGASITIPRFYAKYIELNK